MNALSLVTRGYICPTGGGGGTGLPDKPSVISAGEYVPTTVATTPPVSQYSSTAPTIVGAEEYAPVVQSATEPVSSSSEDAPTVVDSELYVPVIRSAKEK